MQLSYALSSLLLGGFVTPIAAEQLHERGASGYLPFTVTPAFTAHIFLGKPLPTITIPGGVLVAEPIVGGTITGPAINATITSGLATPSIYENGTLQVPIIQAYGTTSDGFGFVLNEAGIGATKAQMTRIQLSIGGGEKYGALRDGFVLATVNPNANQTVVLVQGFILENTAAFM